MKDDRSLSERSPILRFRKNRREVGFIQAFRNEARLAAAFWKRAIKVVLFAIVLLVTIVALFYAEENWRGKHSWEKYKRELAQQGEPLDLQAIAPPPVPDEQNFAMTPLLKPLLDYDLSRPGDDRWNDTNGYQYISKVGAHYPDRNIDLSFGEWTKGKRTDLAAWQQYYRTNAGADPATNFFPIAEKEQTPAKDVLLALSRFERDIEELRSASRRPYSRFPVHYQQEDSWSILLPHLVRVKILTKLTSLRAVAELENGETQQAFEDVQLAFYIAQSVKDEPILISQLVRFASLDFVVQPVWEGIQDHRWTDGQLAHFQRMFGTPDFLSEYPRMVVAECIFMGRGLEYFAAHRDVDWYSQISPGEDMSFVRFVPRGWLLQNAKFAVKTMHEQILPLVDATAHRVYRDRAAKSSTYIQTVSVSPYNFFVKHFGVVFASARFAKMQTTLELAVLACGLERYRLETGSYPDQLERLVPKFASNIPHDIVTGEPLKYRRDGAGYLVYSVGWNGRDDSGAFPKVEEHNTGFIQNKGERHEEGDWVWRAPAP